MSDIRTELVQILIPAVAKLEAQEVKAYDAETDACLYFHPETEAQCLFGHCMKHPEIVGVTAISDPAALQELADSNALDFDELDSISYELAVLQTIHDEKWEPGKRFRDLLSPDSVIILERKLYEALA